MLTRIASLRRLLLLLCARAGHHRLCANQRRCAHAFACRARTVARALTFLPGNRGHTRAAFAQLLGRLKMTKEQLLDNRVLLVRVLDYHIVPGVAAKADDLSDGQKLATMARMPPLVGPRENVTVRFGADESIVIDGLGSDAKVLETDVTACAAVVHVVDTVLLPDKIPGGSASQQ